MLKIIPRTDDYYKKLWEWAEGLDRPELLVTELEEFNAFRVEIVFSSKPGQRQFKLKFRDTRQNKYVESVPGLDVHKFMKYFEPFALEYDVTYFYEKKNGVVECKLLNHYVIKTFLKSFNIYLQTKEDEEDEKKPSV